MILSWLRLVDFRNIDRAALRFSAGLNLIRGENGQGKTNLLEAIGLLATGRSFRRVPPGVMRRHDQPAFFLSGQSLSGGLTHRLGFHGQPQRLTAHLNGKPVASASALGRVLTAVILTPDTPSLIKGGPGDRRDYLDWVVYSRDRQHALRVRDYQTALKARNRLLKSGRGNPREMDAWEARLADIGAGIVQARRQALAALGAHLPQPLGALDLAPERFDWRLSCQLDRGGADGDGLEGDAARYRELLHAHREGDRRSGHTSVGPHRDDLLWHMDGRPLARHGSRGQQKRFVLALKLAEAELAEAFLGEPPLLLLDDPFAELDPDGARRLLALLADRERQLFLATCDEGEIAWPETRGRALFTIADGHITPETAQEGPEPG